MSGLLATTNPRRIKASHRRRRRIASGQSVQRYYDPMIGHFLSVDPVTANSGTGSNFNRYWYANDNPYKFTDPDGREAVVCKTSRSGKSMICSPAPKKKEEESGKKSGSFGQVLLRLFAGGTAANWNMKSSHPSKINQEDAGKIAMQTRTYAAVAAAGIASTPIAAPVASEAVGAIPAREAIYTGCLILGGVCGNNMPGKSQRVRQEREIQESREGSRRESQRPEFRVP